jgi:hypothetical protein
MTDETVACAACELAVPLDRSADLHTPHGPLPLCHACHPDPRPEDTPFGEETDVE